MKVRVPTVTVASVILLCAAGSYARAGGFAEGVVGIASPISDSTYNDEYDASPKLGVRIGSWLRDQDHVLLGFELAADITFLDGPDLPILTDESYNRIRALGGVRIAYDATNTVRVTGRMDVGVDYTRASSMLVNTSNTASDLGLAVDPSVALQIHLGAGSYGVEVGVPIGTHSGKDSDAFVNYNSYDFDFLFVASVDID